MLLPLLQNNLLSGGGSVSVGPFTLAFVDSSYLAPREPGQVKRAIFTSSVLGLLTNAPTTLTYELHPPVGAPDPVIVDSSPVQDAVGTYHSDQLIPLTATPGLWIERISCTGTTAGQNALLERRIRVKRLLF